GGVAFALQLAGELRDEGGVEGALREQAAEQVGEALGDEEGVGRQARTQGMGDQDVANEAEHAARQRIAADGEDGADEIQGPRCLASNRGVAKAAGCGGIIHAMEFMRWTPCPAEDEKEVNRKDAKARRVRAGTVGRATLPGRDR